MAADEMDFDFLDTRPLIVAVAGSNGAGKSTFYHSHLLDCGLPFINADDIAAELSLGAYEAAEVAAKLRNAMVARQESFIFETVFSDPVGEKVKFLVDAAKCGFEVVLIFIQIPDANTSVDRVSMRTAQGGHDVPDEKLVNRFERTRANFERAIPLIPHVLIFDNSDLTKPFQMIAHYRNGKRVS